MGLASLSPSELEVLRSADLYASGLPKAKQALEHAKAMRLEHEDRLAPFAGLTQPSSSLHIEDWAGRVRSWNEATTANTVNTA